MIGLVTFTVNPEICGGWRLATRLHYHRMFEVNSLITDNVYRILTGVFSDIRNRPATPIFALKWVEQDPR